MPKRQPNITATHHNPACPRIERTFHLGHWERMQMSLALDARVIQLRRWQADNERDLAVLLNPALNAVGPHADTVADKEAAIKAIQADIQTLIDLDFALFQHADSVSVTRTDEDN